MVTKIKSLFSHLRTVQRNQRYHLSSGSPTVNNEVISKKLEHYTAVAPTPISIAEFIERGQTKKISEAESYSHLVHECLVRLSHMITEVKQFPRELQEQRDYKTVLAMYLDTYTTLIEFETKEPTVENISLAVKFLNERKARHRDTVPMMAEACMAMKKKYDLNLSQEDCALTKSVQYCLDRLYISRISLNMLTNQHLMLHGYKNPVPGQVGVIHPTADVEAIVRHAYSEARFLCERCYLSAPSLELKSHNLTEPTKPVSVKHVPSHIYYMAFEVIKNAMQATVNHNDLDNLPSIKVLVCQSDNDITIKISDEGGGVDRVTCGKIWKYLYTTAPRPSITSESVTLSGLGYGLPLSRLYARYFQGDVRLASYENHGTDVYVYLHALAQESLERLPIWSDTASEKMDATSSDLSDWVSHNSQHKLKRTGYCFNK